MRASLLLVLVAWVLGCGGGAVSDRCASDADCANGTTCHFGVCGVFTSATVGCDSPAGPAHAYADHSELEELLPGCWLACTPLANPAPENAIGFGISADLSSWWLLVADGSGNAAPLQGFDQGGFVDIVWAGMSQSMSQVNLHVLSSNSGFLLQPSFFDGPPPRMIGDPVATNPPTFVRSDASCGDATDTSSGSQTPFGGSCDENAVHAGDCQPVDGRRCSFCGKNICLQPCHLGGSDCSGSMTCTSFEKILIVMSGDCADYDGYCS